MGAQILGIEYILPSNKITNKDLSDKFPDYDFEKFEEKVGIKNRYWANGGQTALDLAIDACEKLFKRFNKSEIDYLIYCTQSPEYFLPTTACILQNKLGLNKNVGAFDYNLGCSGYVYGLSLAKALIESGQSKNVLLVTSETYSKYIHPQDKSNLAIFGDGATATLISTSSANKIGDFLFGTDGSGADKLIIKNGAGKNKLEFSPSLLSYGSDNVYTDNHLYMNGPEIFNFTAENIPNFTNEVLLKNSIPKSEIDFMVLHQANAFMLEFLRKRIKIEKEKFYIDLEDSGNTVSNTIPIALKKLGRKLLDEEDKKVIVVGFGVGLSWAGGLININKNI
ncbi:ketoacyl-ACP synthase III [Sphingobacterium sp. 1.A.4]|uniref:ketoacyl-ACP synthase III n=1 Tax=Sphingobacterium sp. 1.A.4 TaxID=2044603 RepID=UPI000C0C0300|nr:ketoacyl-ACP synthase III [Sphingobacterium sp. 1.A.4]